MTCKKSGAQQIARHAGILYDADSIAKDSTDLGTFTLHCVIKIIFEFDLV
jgi:hypothetical protein